MTPTAGWVMLVASGLVDVAWAYATKRSNGFTQPGWALLSLLLLAGFIILLSKALQVLPLSAAYAVWTGVGAVGATAVGVLLLGEGVQPARLVFASITVLGVVGLKLSS